jgi:hypothetical protein
LNKFDEPMGEVKAWRWHISHSGRNRRMVGDTVLRTIKFCGMEKQIERFMLLKNNHNLATKTSTLRKAFA